MPTQAAELEAPPQEQEPQDVQPAAAAAAAFEKTLAEPADQTPPSDTPQSTSTAAIPCEPATKPQGITEKTWQKLTSRRRAYVAAYVKDGNALKAYMAAGYVTEEHGRSLDYLKRRAYSVHKGKAVRAAILEHKERAAEDAEARKQFNLDWVVKKLEDLLELAIAKGDLAVATRDVELIGRTRGFFTDSVVVDDGQRRAYSESERIEAARLTRLLLKEGEGGDSEEHTNSPITSSALPAPPPGDGPEGGKVSGQEEDREHE